MELLKILLYLLLIFFPLGVLLRLNIYKSVFIYPMDIVLFFVSLIFFIHIIRKKINPLHFKPFTPLYVFIFLSFITLLINLKHLYFEYFIISLLYLGRFTVYANLMFVFRLLDLNFLKKYVILLSLSGFIAVFFGFVQYFYFFDLRPLYNLGWDEHLYRMFSTYLDPNFTGAVFVLELILLANLFFLNRLSLGLDKYFYVLGMVITTIGIFLTYSRSTFIMLLVSVVALLSLSGKRKYIILLIILFLLGLIILPKRNYSSEGMFLTRTVSVVSRAGSYINALKIFKDSPVFGVGFGTYRYAQKRYGFYDPKNWDITHPGAGVSNSFLLILVTTGIIGLTSFLFLLFKILKISTQKILQNKSSFFFKPYLVSSLIGVIIHSLFENTLFYSFIMFWIFSLIGLYIAQITLLKEKEKIGKNTMVHM